MEQLILLPEQRRPTFLHLINGATQRIRLSMFRCTDFKIMDALADALSRGVSVELLLTQRAKGWEKKIRELGQYLESMGAVVHRYGESNIKYHAKYMVVDGSRALITSMNLMKRYFEKTSDFILLTEDPDIAASLDSLFVHDFQSTEEALPQSLSPRLIVGPEMSRKRLRELLRGACESAVIADHKVTDVDMVELLGELEARGVNVRVMGKGSLAGLKSHGKAMVIDGRLAVLGSIALSLPSLDLRRELAVSFDDPVLVSQLSEYLAAAGEGVGMEAVRVGALAAGADSDSEDEEETEE